MHKNQTFEIAFRRGSDLHLKPFRFFDFFWPFLFLLFFLFAAVIDLLLGFLAVKKTSEEVSSGWAVFSME